ncbi:MAG: hypothetical protein NVV74_18360 [Magnetospirillum sp.]|nr:hypothetical protein [Magnetospirillum sp.]
MGVFRFLAMMAALLACWSGARAGDGRAIFLKSCATCHFASRDPARRDEMVAPPIDVMAVHVRLATGGDRAAFIRQVVDYVRAPAAEKSVDPMAVERFGLMPAIGDTFPDLTEADLALVAGWMYDAHLDLQMPTGAAAGRGMGGGRGR